MTLRKIHKTKKSQSWIYILLLLIMIGAMAGLRFLTKHSEETKMHVGSTDTIRAAVVYGPNSYRVITAEDGKDSIAGINYYLLKALQDSLGMKVEMYPVIDRDDALRKVASGYFDILASLPADNHLKENYLTTKEVSLDKLVLIQNKDDNGKPTARSALDLAGDTVHVEKGSAAVRRIQNLKKEIGDSIHIIEEEGLSEEYMVMKVGTGAWRHAVVNERTAEEMSGTYPNLDYSTPVSFTQFQVWVLPKGREDLLNKINSFLERILERRN